MTPALFVLNAMSVKIDPPLFVVNAMSVKISLRADHDYRRWNINTSRWAVQRSQDPLPIRINESSWVGFELPWISPEYPRMWSNQCRNHESPWNLLEFDHRYHFHQWISQSLLQSDHKKRSIAVCQQNLRPIRSLFFPATLNAKLFIQELWKQEKDWDETFSQSQQQEWSRICESLTPLSSQPLPRYIGGDNTNCSASQMPLPKPIRQQYTSTLQ